MDESRLIEQAQPIQQLLSKNAYERGTQAPELVLFDQFVEIDAEYFKDETKMLPVDEGVLEPKEMMIVILVQFPIELK